MNHRKREGRTEWSLLLGCILFLCSGGMIIISVKYPQFAQWYSDSIYSKIVEFFGRISGAFPFSIVEIGLYIGILTIFITGIFAVVQRKRGRISIFQWFSRVFLSAAILLFLYVSNCGIQYHKSSFSEQSKILVESYSVEELEDTCVWLTEQVNQLTTKVSRTEKGTLELENTWREQVVDCMKRLAKTYPCMSGYYPRPKPVIISEILSYQGITGIYSPFTIEANYNQDMPEYELPFTACHELSHLRGFMQEEEANFIAFLACRESEYSEVQYSGTLSAWVYAMNALYDADWEAWKILRDKLDPSIEVDLDANSQFWSQYEGEILEVANQINDTYLKVNRQEDGIQSYGKMVDLLVAYLQE